MFGSLRNRWFHRSQRQRIILHHGGRRFLLTVPKDTNLPCFNGSLRPHPQLRGTRPGLEDHRKTTSEAYLDFELIVDRLGKFQGIHVPEEFQRQGWASDMVRALLGHYPGIRFYNSSLNEMSGPLFIKLHQELPDRLAPVRRHPDGDYEVLRA